MYFMPYHFLTYFLTYSMQQGHSWEANWFLSQSRNFPHFREPKGSLRHSQVPATCPYPEPAWYSPFPTSWKSILILPFHLHLGLPSGLFTSGFSTTPYICLSCPPYVLQAPPVSFFLILSPEQYWMPSSFYLYNEPFSIRQSLLWAALFVACRGLEKGQNLILSHDVWYKHHTPHVIKYTK